MNAVVMSAQAVQGSTGTAILAVACSAVALFALSVLIVVLRRSSREQTTVSAAGWVVFTTALVGVAVVGGSLTWSPAASADPAPAATRTLSGPVALKKALPLNTLDGLQLPTLPLDEDLP